MPHRSHRRGGERPLGRQDCIRGRGRSLPLLRSNRHRRRGSQPPSDGRRTRKLVSYLRLCRTKQARLARTAISLWLACVCKRAAKIWGETYLRRCRRRGLCGRWSGIRGNCLPSCTILADSHRAACGRTPRCKLRGVRHHSCRFSCSASCRGWSWCWGQSQWEHHPPPP